MLDVFARSALLAFGIESAHVSAPDDSGAPSPGSLALLMNVTLGPAELDQCRAGLASPSAESRATAARVAGLKNRVELVPALRDAMSVESDLAAAREEMLALGRLDGKDSQDTLFAAADRFNGALDDLLLQSLPQRGPAALSLTPRLRGLEAPESIWEIFFDWATRGVSQLMDMAVEAALEIGRPESWEAVLKLSERRGHTIRDADLARAIREGSVSARASTYWYLLRQKGTDAVLGSETTALLQKATEPPSGADGDSVTTLAFELLGRSLGRPSVDRTELLRTLPRASAWVLPTNHKVSELLTRNEADALAMARSGGDDPRKIATALTRPAASLGMKGSLQGVRVRSASGFPPGVVADTLAVTGCNLPKEPALAGVEARYDENGVLSQIRGIPMSGPKGWLKQQKGCEAATRALLLLSVQPTDRPPPPKSTDVILLPLVQEYLGCHAKEQPQLPRLTPQEVNGTVEAPSKTKSVRPLPPARATEGEIVLQTLVTQLGCVGSLEVVAGEHVDLAVQVIVAGAQSRYTPALLAGRPVPTMVQELFIFRR
jgi:hypothetical protein